MVHHKAPNVHPNDMNRVEARKVLGDRTYEAGMRLLRSDAVTLESSIGDTLRIYRVKDRPSRHVVVWNRKGSITIECECTPKEMGCRHCACVYLSLYTGDEDQDTLVEDIRAAIDELSRISFDPTDYLDEAPRDVLITEFYDFIQKRIDRRIRNICGSIDEIPDIGIREELYQSLLTMTGSFESPHDEWSEDTIIASGWYPAE